MKKNIIAIILVFSLLLSFAACRKLDSENIIVESKAYIVDDEGVTRDIYNVGSDYFYYDADGNRKEANSKDVVVETNTVRITEPASLTPEAQSFLDSFGDVDSIEDMMEADETEPQLENDELIPDNLFDEIDVELGEDGKPKHEDTLTYEEILSGDTYTMDVNLKNYVGGTTTVAPFVFMRNGNSLYFETAIPLKEGAGSTRVNFLFLEDTCYIIIPSMRAYMSIPKETVGEIFPKEAFETLEDDQGTYVTSYKVKVDDKTYICDEFENEGTTTKYYYIGNQLKRIENVTGDDTSIMEINTITTSVDQSKFAAPKNYIDLTTMMGEDFDLSTLA